MKFVNNYVAMCVYDSHIRITIYVQVFEGLNF